MAHQTQLEKAKYRKWVRGALSMKYLRDGLERFTDDVIQKEHTRILQQVGITTGVNCTGCSLRDLKPVHTSVYDSTTKRKSCPRGQNNCNCLYPNKTSCPNKICDAIYEEILNTHASSPPSPCLKNTDITKWATHPWEIAKCFINAPGYRDRQSAEEIDLAGLLHVFINNTMFQTSLSCLISGDKRDAFCKVLDLRNQIFHSPNMELEEQDLSECFRNIFTILEDKKKIKHTQCAKEAVKLIKQLQTQDFIITTETEVMILRDIIEQKVNTVEVSNIDLVKGHTQLEKKHSDLESSHFCQEQKLSQLAKGHAELEGGHNELEKKHSKLDEKHTKLEKGHMELEVSHTEHDKRQSGIEQNHSELAKRHSELEERNNELEKRYLGLEQKHTQHEQRLVRVESDVDKLKNLHKNQLTTVERRLDARRKLVDHLQKHYVKTSASPLKTRENEIEISKVYVKPKIKIVKNKLTENKEYKDSKDKPAFAKTYHSIFHSHGKRLRRIYLIGEVGSGKSAFCKMMILNWCRSITKQTDQALCKNELKNIEVMKQFDFLFFLPLRRLQENGRIREMIHWYYRDLIPVEILDEILLNVPEKCVILADGLDEWEPKPDEHRPLHVTDGLPYLEDIDEVTTFTTSRPSAQGVLNMTFTESDQKLVVEGIQSFALMAKKYIPFLNGPKRDSECILDRLCAIEIGRLKESPLLLQQLVWMLGNGITVGKCMSNVYSSLVNVALRWTEEKCSRKKIKNASSCQGLCELHLPKQLVKYEACRMNRNILFSLGKIAFELLVPENNCDSRMSFGRVKLNEDGLDDDMIDTVLSVGLLTEDNCHDNIEHRTQFAFAHASFQEYFAALYVASHPKIDQNRLPDAPQRRPREIILERLFRRFCSVKKILQLGVVLQMLCGLAPEIIHDVCEHVYQIAQHDSTYSNLRDTYLKKRLFSELFVSRYWNIYTYINTTEDMQTLIASCVMEYNCNEETSLHKSTLPVLDLCLRSSKQNQVSGLLLYINPQKVLHLSLHEECSSFITNVVFQNLQTIIIVLYGNDDSNLVTAALNQHLLKTLSVRKCQILSFFSDERVLDLSGHHQLELLNTNCEVVSVDFTNIEILILANANISPIIQGGVAPKLRHLEVCSVPILKTDLIEFAKFISQNVLMYVLKLNSIYCFADDKSSTLIDLSSHDNLQVLEILGFDHISIKYVNTTNLHTLQTSRIDVLNAVRDAQKLTRLVFCGSISYTKEMNEDVCSCSQLQKIELENVTIQDESLVMSCGMRNLKCISLVMVKISLHGWIRFVDSLLNLKQSITVMCKGFEFLEALDYTIRKNKTFKLKNGDTSSLQVYADFEFDTLP